MSRKTWYQGLIYLVVFLYISTVWIAGSENGSGTIIFFDQKRAYMVSDRSVGFFERHYPAYARSDSSCLMVNEKNDEIVYKCFKRKHK